MTNRTGVITKVKEVDDGNGGKVPVRATANCVDLPLLHKLPLTTVTTVTTHTALAIVNALTTHTVVLTTHTALTALTALTVLNPPVTLRWRCTRSTELRRINT